MLLETRNGVFIRSAIRKSIDNSEIPQSRFQSVDEVKAVFGKSTRALTKREAHFQTENEMKFAILLRFRGFEMIEAEERNPKQFYSWPKQSSTNCRTVRESHVQSMLTQIKIVPDHIRHVLFRVLQFIKHFLRQADVSPIKRVWDMIGRRLHLLMNVDDLPRKLEQIWQNLPQETIRVLYHTIPRGAAACIQARCGSTPYSAGYLVTV
ncbi:transposable element Tcb1 transposase [Trichonephila clavipes]|uniref:Transposable element Tcb1 transposase n=1 Tax=Trichonephila clavipes TaxID=2585209 RepID=A0A8X6S294_TRICX|nr:transposable element Tcb1 transposase [Trichonephila clavipes]